MDNTDSIIDEMEDEIDGLKADLHSAVQVAFNRGATEWVKANYPDWYEEFSRQAEVREINEYSIQKRNADLARRHHPPTPG